MPLLVLVAMAGCQLEPPVDPGPGVSRSAEDGVVRPTTADGGGGADAAVLGSSGDAPAGGSTGGCPSSEPLSIVSTSPLAPAQIGKPYSGGIDIKGGVLPLTFQITPSKRPPKLAWLSVDSTNGALSGVPMEDGGPFAFEIWVGDGGEGSCQQVATKSFELRVDRCKDGESVECFVASAGVCSKGVARCNGGQTGSCAAAAMPSNDRAHCGSACEPCDPDRADRCVAGKCQCGTKAACSAGSVCCNVNGTPTCIDVQKDERNCGMCGRKCEAGANARGVCVAGTCASEVMCVAGFERCDPTQPKSCPTKVATDVKNCGACGNACLIDGPAPRANACEMSKCVCGQDKRTCTGATEACCPAAQGLAAGCSDLATGRKVPGAGIRRCGGCDGFCPNPAGNGEATCTGGTCGARCAQGWADCAPNGRAVEPPKSCTIDLANDVQNCGRCGNPCAGPIGGNGVPVCRAGTCQIECARGFTLCQGAGGARCVDLKNDPDHCGACGQTCSGANVKSRPCVAGSCQPVCQPGWGNCSNPARDDGCETELKTMNNCGACGRVCPTDPNRFHVLDSRCVQRSDALLGVFDCAGRCVPGFDNCDRDYQRNGCEIDLSSLDDCGRCGNRCARGGSDDTASCSSGSCSISCGTGRQDCDSDPGCETDITSDASNCGGCNNRCSDIAPGYRCVDSQCIPPL